MAGCTDISLWIYASFLVKTGPVSGKLVLFLDFFHGYIQQKESKA